MSFLAASVALANPWLDPTVESAATATRIEGVDRLQGAGLDEPWTVGTWKNAPRVVVMPALRYSIGEGEPFNAGGDLEPGGLSGVARVDTLLSAGPFIAWVTPEANGAFVPGADFGARFDTAWLGVDSGTWSAGFGRRDRWLGPGRHGALVLSDNARPPWLGNAAIEGRLPGVFDRLGRWRLEAGGGWMDRPRRDVAHPGLLLMDLRWPPVPALELGLTRMAMFGGVDRPRPDIGQLILPTEPHVEDDPEHLLPDQNELAALDGRLCLPLQFGRGGPFGYAELWLQYGGEDVIARSLGPIPYPSLAGIGNLFGAALSVGPMTLTGEYTRLMDDTFRWYVGHRVYHEGFTQDGRPLGHWGGTDSETGFASVAVKGRRLRGTLWGDVVRRVGVIGTQGDTVFAFPEEERRWRMGLGGGWLLPNGGWLEVGYALERVRGEDFVHGADGWTNRATVALAPGLRWASGR